MPSAIDLTGKTFGRLLVKEMVPHHSGYRSRAHWRCECACGADCVVRGDDMQRGKVASCGCLRRERFHGLIYRHGLSRTPEYRSWKGLRSRCTSPTNPKYPYYGGRGISFCERWNSYENFYADMGPRPSPKHSIDRINNDGNYEPSNCRWATHLEQVNNRSNSKRKERCA